MPHHPLVASIFHRFFFPTDYMHAMDCKGCAQLTYGGVLGRLTSLTDLGPNVNARLRLINRERIKWYGEHPDMHRLPCIRVASLKSDIWWNLSGKVFKAAICRHASVFV